MSDWSILEAFITHPPYITVGIQSSSWPHAEDKLRPLIRRVCCKGWTTSIFSSRGKSHTRQNIVFFPPLPLLVLRLSPPSHRTALCSSGGRGACTATSVLLAAAFRPGLRRGVLAGRRSCNAETFRGVGPSHTATSLWLAQSGNPGYPAGCLMSSGYWRSEVGPRVTMWWLCLCWPIDLHIWF